MGGFVGTVTGQQQGVGQPTLYSGLSMTDAGQSSQSNPIDALFAGTRWRREDVALVVAFLQLAILMAWLVTEVS